MRKIDGLKIDFKTGEGDICLDPSFLGQSAAFQAVVCSYWVARLLDHRNSVMAGTTDNGKKIVNKNLDFKTIEEIVKLDHAVLLIEKSKHQTSKKLLISTNLFKAEKQTKSHYFLWESVGYNTFICLTKIECPQNSLKTIRRKTRAMFSRWDDLQHMIIESSGGRLGEAKPYRHFVADINEYLYGVDVEKEMASV